MSKKTEKILALLDKGMKPTYIAEKVGVSDAYVYTLRSKSKAKKKPGRPKKVETKEKWTPVLIDAEALLPPAADAVNHPPHHTTGGVEVLDYIEAKDFNYRLGNVIKYISRAGKKDGTDPIQDLEKAAFYLNREIIIRKGA